MNSFDLFENQGINIYIDKAMAKDEEVLIDVIKGENGESISIKGLHLPQISSPTCSF